MSVIRARRLRRDLTGAERLLWAKLRNRQLDGFKFRRQVPIGRYIVDFVCFEAKLVIELDGGQHSEQAEYDAMRTQCLAADGFKVMRFWNAEVIRNLEGVLDTILVSLGRPLA